MGLAAIRAVRLTAVRSAADLLSPANRGITTDRGLPANHRGSANERAYAIFITSHIHFSVG
jgi:hypothetical protein